MREFSIYPISESAVTLKFADAIDHITHNKIMSFCNSIRAAQMPGFVELVPAYTTLTLYFDFIKVQQSKLAGDSVFQKIKNFLQAIGSDSQAVGAANRLIELPVCYDESFGIDLQELSAQNQLSIRDIIQLHSQREYTVYMIGFTPGFPYMGEIDQRLFCSRKANPRKKVPSGSVAIAGKQTGIYPFDTPGGWQIIGRTPVQLFSIHQNPPALLQAGMRIKFSAITRNEFETLSKP